MGKESIKTKYSLTRNGRIFLVNYFLIFLNFYDYNRLLTENRKDYECHQI